MEKNKIPFFIYLGIKVEISKDFFFEKIINNLKTEKGNLLEMIGDISLWKDPNDYHITTFFGGRAKKNLKKKRYEEFPKDKEIEIKISHLVFTSDYNICFVVKVLDSNIEITNKIPHITFLVKNSKPFESNLILEDLLKQDANVFNKIENKEYIINVKSGKKESIVFKLKEDLLIKGKTYIFKGNK